MPTYDYSCKDCLRAFTVEAKMNDPAPTCAPGCASQQCMLVKRMSPVMGWVKGSGMLRSSAKARESDRALSTAAPKNMPMNAAAVAERPDPVHVCAKYCSHHTKP
ncbi:MAG: zinc ribbon domain-containing protein [Chitinophagaceae bacterium]|nr:zinc ribbon domain-containing protein [Oligoflexus sp.]